MYKLGVLDYITVALFLIISAVIGIVFRFIGGRQSTTNEYLLGGKKMSKFPVVLSLSVSSISAIAMLGFPAEIYKFGAQYILLVVSQAIGNILAAYIVIPVYFQCGVSTIYEYLEMRFGKTTRFIAYILFIVQMVLYMSTALYGPALAMSVVTDISIETSIFVFAGVCTFYCTVGGLKAVMWTDVFQTFLMFITLIISHISAINEVGGISKVYNRAASGRRLELFNFSMDLTTRYTFWNVIFLGLVEGIGNYSTDQIQVQRLLSLSTSKRAQSASLWSIIPIASLYSLCISLGAVLYAVFYLCDPILNASETGLNKYDQLLPFYIVTRFSYIPCLTGLCVSGIFSGALSTVSSIINALSAVTVKDIIKPVFSGVNFSDMKLLFMAKGLTIFYGGLCICLALLISQTDSILEASYILLGTTQGPVYAMFLIGMLSTRTTERNILFGLMIATLMTSWIGIGSLYHGESTPSLPLNTSLCPSTNNISVLHYDPHTTATICQRFQNCSDSFAEFQDASSKKPFILYRISFMWITTIGYFLTMSAAYISSIFTGWNKKNKTHMKCMSPITKLWMPRLTGNEMEMESMIDNKARTTVTLRQKNLDNEKIQTDFEKHLVNFPKTASV